MNGLLREQFYQLKILVSLQSANIIQKVLIFNISWVQGISLFDNHSRILFYRMTFFRKRFFDKYIMVKVHYPFIIIEFFGIFLSNFS